MAAKDIMIIFII